MTDEEFGGRFAFTLGMMTALSREMLSRRFVLQNFEDRGIPLEKFETLSDVCMEISAGYYADRKGKVDDNAKDD